MWYACAFPTASEHNQSSKESIFRCLAANTQVTLKYVKCIYYPPSSVKFLILGREMPKMSLSLSGLWCEASPGTYHREREIASVSLLLAGSTCGHKLQYWYTNIHSLRQDCSYMCLYDSFWQRKSHQSGKKEGGGGEREWVTLLHELYKFLLHNFQQECYFWKDCLK